MTTTWYYVQYGEITPVQVSKVTAQFVYTVDAGYGERRNAISSSWGDYYPTRVQAVASLALKYRNSIEQAKRTIAGCESNLERLQREYPAEFEQAQQPA